MDHDYHHLLQRIEVTPKLRKGFGTLMFRSCYYTLAAASRKPIFGQYHPAVPEKSFRSLMRKADKRGWFKS